MRAIAPRADAGSLRASNTHRVARSCNSDEYFLGRPIISIPACQESLHQTRGDAVAFRLPFEASYLHPVDS